jgi:hypothetical protein
MIYDVLVDLPASSSPGEGEVVQTGDAEHGVVDAVAFEPAVAEDLPGLHAGEGVLDAGPDLAVGGVLAPWIRQLPSDPPRPNRRHHAVRVNARCPPQSRSRRRSRPQSPLPRPARRRHACTETGMLSAGAGTSTSGVTHSGRDGGLRRQPWMTRRMAGRPTSKPSSLFAATVATSPDRWPSDALLADDRDVAVAPQRGTYEIFACGNALRTRR